MCKNLLLSLALILGGISFAPAATLSGDRLDISSGPPSNNTVNGLDAGAIGQYNTVNGWMALAVGTTNTVTASYAFALGYANQVSASCSASFGSQNVLSQANSLANGHWINMLNNGTGADTDNLYSGLAHTGSGNSGTAVFGGWNAVSANMNALVTGTGNYANAVPSGLIAGEYNYATGKQIVLGTGLIATNSAQAAIVVGQYNEALPTAPAAGTPQPLFVVGSGTGVGNPQNRKNAMVINNDGSIRIPKRQGDIRMGEFGLSND